MTSNEVLSEQVKENARRLGDVEKVVKEQSKVSGDLLVVTGKHSEQLTILMRALYGLCGVVVLEVIKVLAK